MASGFLNVLGLYFSRFDRAAPRRGLRIIIHNANLALRYATIQGFGELADARAMTALISSSAVRAAVAA